MGAEVERRARGRCEYCRAPQLICAYTFHLEHVIPRAKGGAETLANTALACFSCNSAKSTFVTGFDPVSGDQVPLFNPRRQKWSEHFAWKEKVTKILGKTATGRATVARLKLNATKQMRARALWKMTDGWR